MVDRKDKPWTVYRATCLVSKKSYIGITSTAEHVRWAAHLRDVRNGRRESAFHLAIRKYGADAFVREILYVCVNWREAIAVERGAIAAHRTLTPNGYNISVGGEGHIGAASKGKTFSEAHKEHLRRLAAAMKGKKRNPESVEKGRKSLMGHFVSQETRARMGAAQRGVPIHTEESKARISQGNRGLVRTAEQKEKMGTGQVKAWADPERRAARLAKAKAAREKSGRSHSDVMFTRYQDDPELRARIGERVRAFWADPEKKAAILESRTTKRDELGRWVRS
jgi:group I intron endonuclease